MKIEDRIIAEKCNNAAGLTDVMFSVRGMRLELCPERLRSPYYKHLDPNEAIALIVSVGDSYRIPTSVLALGITKEILQQMRAEWIKSNRPKSENIWASHIPQYES